ncbi:hypothetical protein ACOMHN_045599 [Nucella lapillus]
MAAKQTKFRMSTYLDYTTPRPDSPLKPALLAVLAGSSLHTGPQVLVEAQANCQSPFLNRVLQCASNSTLNPQNFLWLTREGAMGTKPANISAFTQQACLLEVEVSQCFKGVSDQFQSLTACSDADKNTIQTFYKNVVKTYDSKCAEPCREQLIPSMAQCFTSAEVNATLFLSNVTMPRHRMLGQHSDVDAFCAKREDILECMEMKTAMCPETPDILMSAGIDVDALNDTLALLCDNILLYVHGARCGENRSREEEQCQTDLTQELSDLESQFQDLNINRSVYAMDLCRVRLDHIRCDLGYMSRRQNDSKCPDEVLGLRREQECTLIPADCKSEFKARVMDLCDPLRFMRETE